MNLKKLTKSIVITIFTLIYYGCKSTLYSKENNVESMEIVHKNLVGLIKKDSINSFYKLFNENNYNPNHIGKLGTSLLFDAVSNDNIEICDFLLKNGADINFVSKYGTVMHWALEKSNINLADFLLNKGYDPKIEKRIKINPEPLNFQCVFAIRKNKIKGIKLFKKMLNKGMNPNLMDKNGVSAIHLAVYFENLELINILCQKGANMNLKSISKNNNSKKDIPVSNNYTPLMFASYFEKEQSVSELLKCKNVEIKIKSKDNKTALDIAKEKNNKPIIELITIANNI
ncbi:ankyrin repeat domain-containing protein [Tenacibaculum sp.]|nr:ankyrin repeat domain-containing protein [Tenacibaculum sp.]